MALAYMGLLAADFNIARVALSRRVRSAVVCSAFSLLSVVSGLAWLIAGTWNTPYRYAVLGGLTVGFGAIALVAGLSGRPKDVLFENVRAEWRGDQLALAAFLGSEPGDGQENAP